jgi:hypothetical protein
MNSGIILTSRRLCALLLAFAVDTESVGAIAPNNDTLPSPEQLLAKLEQARDQLHTLEMTVQYEELDLPPTVKRRYEAALEHGLATDTVRRYFGEDVEEFSPESRRTTHVILLDTEGRGRVLAERVNKIPNDEPNAVAQNAEPSPAERGTIWDGAMGFEYSISSKQGVVFRDGHPFEHTTRARHPWHQFGGTLARTLRSALDNDTPMSVEWLPAVNMYELKIERPRDGMLTVHISPSEGYSVPFQEFSRDGQVLFRYTARFEEHDNGVWLPLKGTDERFSFVGELLQTTEITITDVHLNAPDFAQRVLDITLPEGAVIIDGLSQEKYELRTPVHLGAGGVFGTAPLNELIDLAVRKEHAQPNIPSPVRVTIPMSAAPLSSSEQGLANPALLAASVMVSLTLISFVYWHKHRNRI